jgi:cell division protein WhiA
VTARSAFGEVVRRELTERPPRRRCCGGALLCGIFRHAGTLELSGGGVAVRAELADAAAARLVFRLVRELGGDGQLASFREPRFARGTRVLVRLQGDRNLQLLHEVGVLSTGLAPLAEPPGRLMQRRCCRASYLRGAFVAAGSVSAPRAAGHLEIRAPEPEGAAFVQRVARPDAIPLRVTARRGHAVAYAKSKQTIRELLAHMGAHDAVLSLDEAEVISRTRERANRATNCDEANLVRQGKAARAQAEAISALDLDALGARLRQVADLRLQHPDLSLAELGQRALPPLSKSTVAGRMRLLVTASKASLRRPSPGPRRGPP